MVLYLYIYTNDMDIYDMYRWFAIRLKNTIKKKKKNFTKQKNINYKNRNKINNDSIII